MKGDDDNLIEFQACIATTACIESFGQPSGDFSATEQKIDHWGTQYPVILPIRLGLSFTLREYVVVWA